MDLSSPDSALTSAIHASLLVWDCHASRWLTDMATDELEPVLLSAILSNH